MGWGQRCNIQALKCFDMFPACGKTFSFHQIVRFILLCSIYIMEPRTDNRKNWDQQEVIGAVLDLMIDEGLL